MSVPFKDMPSDAQHKIIQILAEGGTVEQLVHTPPTTTTPPTPRWDDYHSPIINVCCVYRVKKTKPLIDWSAVHPDYKWLARDMDGEVVLYKEVPKTGSVYWVSNTEVYLNASIFASLDPGTCDWRESLVERPE